MRAIHLLLFLLVYCSCSTDKRDDNTPDSCDTNELTYTNDILPIFNTSCAYIGCHVASTTPAIGDYRDYESVVKDIESGQFETYVLETTWMPPSDTPEDRPQILTIEELELLKCWVDSGYAE